jgi:phenylpropionate dioxygenase-like ring-hydroxylating dioxygenase large terminal subunit
MTPHHHCHDPVIGNQWHVVSPVEALAGGAVQSTRLLGSPIECRLDDSGAAHVGLIEDDGARELPSQIRYGYVWATLGTPEKDLFDIPEFSEPGRKNLHAVMVGINVSAPRAIENFLDMAHFPFVHTDILGAEPYTEIKEYKVETNDLDEIIVKECRIYQPVATAASTGAADVDYIYRIPHPYCSILYKTSGEDSSKFDVIALFVQPETEETVRANMMCSLIDSSSSITRIRSFQQTIFGQDKPILENQFPKRLPLDPRAETPIRADKSAIAYRRWLARKGVTYGVIPAAA